MKRLKGLRITKKQVALSSLAVLAGGAAVGSAACASNKPVELVSNGGFEEPAQDGRIAGWEEFYYGATEEERPVGGRDKSGKPAFGLASDTVDVEVDVVNDYLRSPEGSRVLRIGTEWGAPNLFRIAGVKQAIPRQERISDYGSAKLSFLVRIENADVPLAGKEGNEGGGIRLTGKDAHGNPWTYRIVARYSDPQRDDPSQVSSYDWGQDALANAGKSIQVSRNRWQRVEVDLNDLPVPPEYITEVEASSAGWNGRFRIDNIKVKLYGKKDSKRLSYLTPEQDEKLDMMFAMHPELKGLDTPAYWQTITAQSNRQA